MKYITWSVVVSVAVGLFLYGWLKRGVAQVSPTAATYIP